MNLPSNIYKTFSLAAALLIIAVLAAGTTRALVAGPGDIVQVKKEFIVGLDGAFTLAVSPDGKHIYVAGITDSAIAVFSRNSISGALTFVEVQQDGVNGIDGLDGVSSVTVSPDGNHVYTASQGDDAVIAFSRNSSTGALTFDEVQKDGDNQGHDDWGNPLARTETMCM